MTRPACKGLRDLGDHRGDAVRPDGHRGTAAHGWPDTAVRYRCEGSVRGWCGHEHTTLRGAWDCLQRDRNGCASLNSSGSLTRSYSDRLIVRTDGEELSDAEHDSLADYSGEADR